MYSAYLFLAFIFGRTLVVQATTNSELTFDVVQIDKTEITIKMQDAGAAGTGYEAKVHEKPDASDAGTVLDPKSLDTAIKASSLKPATTYYFQISKTASGGAQSKSPIEPITTSFGDLTDVTVEKVELTSATFKWGSFTDYKDTSVKVDSGDKKDVATETYVLEELKPSTKSTVLFQGFKTDDTGGFEQSIDICTAPSKPTITKKIESTTATTPVHTLTLTIKFADGEKVSSLDFETGVDLTVEPTCDACNPTTLAISEKKKFTANLASDANEVVVVLGEYPEANAATDIQVTAKFDSESACTAANSVGVLETTMNSVATLANKEAMLVYLAIGTMATVLRLLGMEVWTPIGLL